MKIFKGMLTCLIVLALVGIIMPVISINVSSEVLTDNTRSQSISYNITVLKDEILHLDNHTLGHIAKPLVIDELNQMLYVGT